MRALSQSLISSWHFAGVLLRADLKNTRAFVLALFQYVFILALIWLTTRGSRNGEIDLMVVMFPVYASLAVLFSGQAIAMRLVVWRQQGVFQRLACTPVPLGYLVLGAGLTQVIVSLIQTIGVLLFGVLVLRIPINFIGTLAAIGSLGLGAVCFTAYGTVIASFARRAELASMLFFFTLLPLFFLDGGLPEGILPPFVKVISPWLPTTQLAELTGPLMRSGTLPDTVAFPVLVLLTYTLVFAVITVKTFRWE